LCEFLCLRFLSQSWLYQLGLDRTPKSVPLCTCSAMVESVSGAACISMLANFCTSAKVMRKPPAMLGPQYAERYVSQPPRPHCGRM
jgi:hypothetical protein